MNMMLVDSQSITIIVIASVIFVLGLACLIYKIAKHIKRNKTGVEVIDDTRYTTTDKTQKEDGSVNVSVNTSDLMLVQDKDYIVSKDGELKPGKYTILSTQEGLATVSLRIGHYVRTYKHGSSIVFVEGEKVTPVSTSVILR